MNMNISWYLALLKATPHFLAQKYYIKILFTALFVFQVSDDNLFNL